MEYSLAAQWKERRRSRTQDDLGRGALPGAMAWPRWWLAGPPGAKVCVIIMSLHHYVIKDIFGSLGTLNMVWKMKRNVGESLL